MLPSPSRTRTKNMICLLSNLPIGRFLCLEAHKTRTIIPNAIGCGDGESGVVTTCLVMTVIIVDIHSQALTDRHDWKNRRNFEGIFKLVSPHKPNYMGMHYIISSRVVIHPGMSTYASANRYIPYFLASPPLNPALSQ